MSDETRGHRAAAAEKASSETHREKLQEFGDTIRAMIEHENTLINNRMSWMNVLQGLLFTAFSRLGENVEIAVVTILGFLVSFSFFVSFRISRVAVDNLLDSWDDRLRKSGESRKDFPPVFALRERDQENPFVRNGFLAPWSFLPVIFGLAWWVISLRSAAMSPWGWLLPLAFLVLPSWMWVQKKRRAVDEEWWEESKPPRSLPGVEEKPEDAWWRGGVIYQIYPRSFRDSNGDGVGDLPGITSQIDYIAELGVDGIWISPFMRSPMKDFGYDVSDYRDVDPVFGTLADFDALIQKSDSLGLKVIIDVVASHTSDQHQWFEESRRDRSNRRADWYVWADPKPDGTPPNNWLSIFGGPAWSWSGERGQYYQHNFLPSQPTLNYNHPEVIEAMLGEMRFWLERGVSGFRIDAITCMRQDPGLRDNPAKRGPKASGEPVWRQEHFFDRNRKEILGDLRRIRGLLDEYGDTFSVGEVGDVNDPIRVGAAYTRGKSWLHTTYNFELLGDVSVAKLEEVVRRAEAASSEATLCYSFSNHDVERTVTRWGRALGGEVDEVALAKVLMALLLSLRGSVFLYQGEELGLGQAAVPQDQRQDPVGRDGCRTPFPWSSTAPRAGFSTGKPWLPVDSSHQQRAVDVQEGDSESVLDFTRHFLGWRKKHPALTSGDFRFRSSREPLLAFERRHPDERLLAVFNLSGETHVYRLPGRDWWRLLANSGFGAADVDGGRVNLPPFGAFFALGRGAPAK